MIAIKSYQQIPIPKSEMSIAMNLKQIAMMICELHMTDKKTININI
jgi:hypothetical protein